MKHIFITGRFRSGSTFLWRLFSSLPQFHAYYEPLHPNLPESIAHITPSKSHAGTSSYWQEYRHLRSSIKAQHQKAFAHHQLALPSSHSFPELKNYIDYLSHTAPSSQVVLQFNRADFRLGWLKQTYPQAKVIHIHRNIRDSWQSSRRHLPLNAQDDMFQFNCYELLQWAISLDTFFPFILDHSTTPYHIHYFLAVLSQHFANKYADLSIDFDLDIQKNTENFSSKISAFLDINNQELEAFLSTKVTIPPKQFSSDKLAWFNKIEEECNEIITQLNILNHTPEELLALRLPIEHPEKRTKIIQQLLGYTYQLEGSIIKYHSRKYQFTQKLIDRIAFWRN